MSTQSKIYCSIDSIRVIKGKLRSNASDQTVDHCFRTARIVKKWTFSTISDVIQACSSVIIKNVMITIKQPCHSYYHIRRSVGPYLLSFMFMRYSHGQVDLCSKLSGLVVDLTGVVVANCILESTKAKTTRRIVVSLCNLLCS